MSREGEIAVVDNGVVSKRYYFLFNDAIMICKKQVAFPSPRLMSLSRVDTLWLMDHREWDISSREKPKSC